MRLRCEALHLQRKDLLQLRRHPLRVPSLLSPTAKPNLRTMQCRLRYMRDGELWLLLCMRSPERPKGVQAGRVPRFSVVLRLRMHTCTLRVRIILDSERRLTVSGLRVIGFTTLLVTACLVSLGYAPASPGQKGSVGLNDIREIAERWWTAHMKHDADALWALMTPAYRQWYGLDNLKKGARSESQSLRVYLGLVEISQGETLESAKRAVVRCATTSRESGPSQIVVNRIVGTDIWRSHSCIGLERRDRGWGIRLSFPDKASWLDDFLPPPRKVVGNLLTELRWKDGVVERKTGAQAPVFEDTVEKLHRWQAEQRRLRERTARRRVWFFGAVALFSLCAGSVAVMMAFRQKKRNKR